MADDILECDLLVIGAGMAGLSAAARAAESGAHVVVVEKAAEPGGSALLSGGYVWHVLSRKHLQAVDDGDQELGWVVNDGYADAIAWLRKRGMLLTSLIPVVHGFGYQTDIVGHIRDCALTVEGAGGHVVTDTEIAHLDRDETGRVIGATTRHADGAMSVRAPWTLLATGGFQANPELRARYINPIAGQFILRSNPNSVGDGLRLAESVGGGFGGPNPGFYGHLLCHPANLDDPAKRRGLYRSLAQYHSEFCLLFDRQGQRFCDESRGDHLNTQEVAFRPDGRAILLWDQRVQEDHVSVPHAPGAVPVDRLQSALAQGGEGALCQTLEEIVRVASSYQFDGAALVKSLLAFNEKVAVAPEGLKPARTGELKPFDRPPYYLLIVQPGITFTHGGIKVDPQARVLDTLSKPIPGLLAAGADAGNIYRRGYAGGLALALTFGLRAAATAGYA